MYGEPSLSPPRAAGIPFGDALHDVAVGTPIVDARALAELRLRGVGASAPPVPVFVHRLDRYELPLGPMCSNVHLHQLLLMAYGHGR